MLIYAKLHFTDVKDASRKDTDSVVVSKVSLAVPVLQKLTKLRESLSRRALYTDPVGFYRNEKNNKMEEHDKIHPENKPDCALNNSNARMTKTNMTEMSECDSRDTCCSLQDNTVISISSDSPIDDVDQPPVDMDIGEECLLEDKKTSGFEDKTNKDDQDTDFVEKLDKEISCETDSNGDDKNIDISIDQKPCRGLAGTDNCENFDQEKRNKDTNQSDDILRNVTDTGPIKIDSHFSSYKQLTGSPATYDSQFSSDTLDSQGNDELGSDSDNDLLLPTTFLYEKTSKPIVHTPEKITTPLGASPMSSPVKPVKNLMQELEERKYRFPVNKLLKEKNRREVKNAALTKIEADLDAGIKKGGIKSITDMFSEDETDSEIDGETD